MTKKRYSRNNFHPTGSSSSSRPEKPLPSRHLLSATMSAPPPSATSATSAVNSMITALAKLAGSQIQGSTGGSAASSKPPAPVAKPASATTRTPEEVAEGYAQTATTVSRDAYEKSTQNMVIGDRIRFCTALLKRLANLDQASKQDLNAFVETVINDARKTALYEAETNALEAALKTYISPPASPSAPPPPPPLPPATTATVSGAPAPPGGPPSTSPAPAHSASSTSATSTSAPIPGGSSPASTTSNPWLQEFVDYWQPGKFEKPSSKAEAEAMSLAKPVNLDHMRFLNELYGVNIPHVPPINYFYEQLGDDTDTRNYSSKYFLSSVSTYMQKQSWSDSTQRHFIACVSFLSNFIRNNSFTKAPRNTLQVRQDEYERLMTLFIDQASAECNPMGLLFLHAFSNMVAHQLKAHKGNLHFSHFTAIFLYRGPSPGSVSAKGPTGRKLDDIWVSDCVAKFALWYPKKA